MPLGQRSADGVSDDGWKTGCCCSPKAHGIRACVRIWHSSDDFDRLTCVRRTRVIVEPTPEERSAIGTWRHDQHRCTKKPVKRDTNGLDDRRDGTGWPALSWDPRIALLALSPVVALVTRGARTAGWSAGVCLAPFAACAVRVSVALPMTRSSRRTRLGRDCPHAERGQHRDASGVEGPALAAAPVRSGLGCDLGRRGGRCRLGADALTRERWRSTVASGVRHRGDPSNQSRNPGMAAGDWRARHTAIRIR